jgi:hypothetical protein
MIEDYPGLNKLKEFLFHVEDAIFPSLSMYMSSGHTETIGNCSICGLKFLLCDHIENQIYMGRLCRRVGRKILKLNHVALVENPKDRRCIITQISDMDGSMIDYFTRKIINDRTDESDTNSMKAIILTAHSLDLD